MAKNDIEDAVKPIQEAWPEIKNEFFQRNPGRYLILSSVHRTPKEQFELFKKGRTMSTQGDWVVQSQEQVVTNVDGHSILGAHNYMPSRAIDVAIVDNQTGKTIWEESSYSCLLEIAQGVGLESGLEWKKFKDACHIQVRNFKTYREV